MTFQKLPETLAEKLAENALKFLKCVLPFWDDKCIIKGLKIDVCLFPLLIPSFFEVSAISMLFSQC